MLLFSDSVRAHVNALDRGMVLPIIKRPRSNLVYFGALTSFEPHCSGIERELTSGRAANFRTKAATVQEHRL